MFLMKWRGEDDLSGRVLTSLAGLRYTQLFCGLWVATPGPVFADMARLLRPFSHYAGDLNAQATEYLKVQNSPI